MLRERSYYFLFLVPVLTLAACGGDKQVDETTGAVQEAIPSGGYHFAGTYANSSRQVGTLSQLVLKTDGTFHSAKVVACITAPCNDVEQNGTYTLFRRDTFASPAVRCHSSPNAAPPRPARPRAVSAPAL